METKYKTFKDGENRRITDQETTDLDSQTLKWLAENGDEEATKQLAGAKNIEALARSQSKRKAKSCATMSLNEDRFDESGGLIGQMQDMIADTGTAEISALRDMVLCDEDEEVLDILRTRDGCEKLAVIIDKSIRHVQLWIVAMVKRIEAGEYYDGMLAEILKGKQTSFL